MTPSLACTTCDELQGLLARDHSSHLVFVRVLSDDGRTTCSSYRCPVTGQEWIETSEENDRRWAVTDRYWDIIEAPAEP